jgi:hypothetical protein
MTRRITKLCGNDKKFTPTNILKRGNGFFEWDNTLPITIDLKALI